MGNTKPYINMKKLKVLGVCSGVGASIFTFHKRKNFEVIGSVEPRTVFHTKKEEQWKLNFDHLPFERSITPKIRKLKPDIIIGHPDCGDSSVLRMSRAKKKGNVGENSSVLLFFESINHYRPSMFLLENLPGFLKTYTENRMNDILDERYELCILQGSVAMFGNSQVSRNRLVVIGIQKWDIHHSKCYRKLFEILCLAQTQSQSQNLNMEFRSLNAYGLLVPFHPLPAKSFEIDHSENLEIGHYREPLEKMTNLYHTPTNRRQITYSEASLIWQQLPESCQRWPVGGKMKNQPGVSRHSASKPPLTVRKQNRQFGTHNLVLSPREMANIQGFPISFRLFVDLDQRVYWLNKNRVAVTKTCPYEIPLWFKRVIKQSIL